QGIDVEGAEHNRIVAVNGGVEAEQTQTIERENHLDQKRAGEEDADEGRGNSGDDDQHGVAKDVAVQHPPTTQPFGAGAHDVVLMDLVKERVLGQHGQPGETADEQGDDRQSEVPEVVGDGRRPAELLPVVRDETAQREPGKITATGEEDDQQDGKEETGNGV